MKRVFRWIIFGFSLFVIIGILICCFYEKDKPPVTEIKKARDLIAIARSAGADRFASTVYKNAVSAYDSAMYYWNTENEKLAFFRNHDKTREWALKANELAENAAKQSKDNSARIKSKLSVLFQETENKMKRHQKKFNNIPQPESVRQIFRKGEIQFNEAHLAYEKGDFNLASSKLNDASQNINKAYNFLLNHVRNYFNAFESWKSWVAESIAFSKKHKKSCIVIDKFAHECFLYQNGQLKATFEVDLGKNWIGNKMFQDDHTTPEGKYKIVEKKQNGKTRYHKALLINYPNQEDIIRFEKNKKNGTISARKKIGGLIEIHGQGGQGADWTQGCVALSNDDMDRLFALVELGTPVIIVGSTQTVEEILK